MTHGHHKCPKSKLCSTAAGCLPRLFPRWCPEGGQKSQKQVGAILFTEGGKPLHAFLKEEDQQEMTHLLPACNHVEGV